MHRTETSPASQSSTPPTVSPIVGAIPARWASTRLPGKPLRAIAGKPMIEHVFRRASAAPSLDRVVVLTDDERIARAVEDFGGDVEMTPADCASGTDRIAWAARRWTVGAVVNIQGDEPLIDPQAVDRVARALSAGHSMVTLATEAQDEELDDPNAVKVVLDRAGDALYFSRSRIPFPRRSEPTPAALKHIGIYGYHLDTLSRLAALEPTPLERAESLEQLRALEHGISIRVLQVDSAEPGVDTEADLERVAARLASRDGQ
ncbi:MAG: 3-deoxy-manno-octulosonate cytidylyltransferase [Acidobacteriota bacterium]